MKLIQRVQRTLDAITGSFQPPKAKNLYTTPSISPIYQGMDQNYRWFRQDELTRKSITLNASFSTQKGFETESEDNELKERIDDVNKKINLDKALYIAQIKRSIHGKAAFEIIRDKQEIPTKLLPLQSTQIKPEVDENWNLTGFTYKGKKNFYTPEDVFYLTNLELESNHLGLSELEPIRDTLETRHTILRENIPEITRTLWAPYVILKADTSSLPVDEAEAVITELANVARAGKSIALNESVEATVVHLKPDIQGLNTLLEKLEDTIIANFSVPRFLLGRPIENRATAYAELEAYVTGPINNIQRYLRREIEAQLYTPITEAYLKEKGKPEGSIKTKHIWNTVRAHDIYMQADAASKLWGTHGTGPIGDNKEKIWEIMNWDPTELEENP